MAAMIDDPGGRVLHSLAHSQTLRRWGYLDGRNLRVGATGKWQDDAKQSQHLEAITSGHP